MDGGARIREESGAGGGQSLLKWIEFIYEKLKQESRVGGGRWGRWKGGRGSSYWGDVMWWRY